MEGHFVVNSKEIHRSKVLQQVIDGHLSLSDAAAVLGVGYRQAKRLKRDFHQEGLPGLIHGNRGKRPPNALPELLKETVLNLRQQNYFDFNDSHFTEMLSERENIHLSRETVRLWLRGSGVQPKRRRRPPRHRSRRPRKEMAGLMLQWDGSPHAWFGADRPPCCLMAAVDDATGIIVGALFVSAESSIGYLRLLEMILRRHGIPLSLYHDRHSSLVRNDPYWSLEEQLQGLQFPTHVGRVLAELGIESICANSPQAKGRVENRFKTLQDRLIAEMRLHDITTIEQANPWLERSFIPRYNKRFAQVPAKAESAFIGICPEQIEHVVSFAYEAVVGNDNAVRLGGLIIDIPAGKNHFSYAKKKVLVRQHLDGHWSVWWNSQKIAQHELTELKEPVRSWKKRTSQSPSKTREMLQVYIASKPAPPPKGTFSFCS
jgi:transposase